MDPPPGGRLVARPRDRDRDHRCRPRGEAARDALVAHATLRDAWRGGAEAATGWGSAVAAWFGAADPAERDDAVAAIFAAAARSSRPSFAQGLLRGLAPAAGASTLARLRANPSADRAMLLPLEAGLAAAALIAAATRAEAGEDLLRTEVAAASASLGRLVQDAASLPGATAATLSAAAALAADHPRYVDLVAQAVAGAFDLEAAGSGAREALAWALHQEGDAPTWLAPALRPRLADLDRGAVFDLLRDQVEPDQWPRLARAVLAVADDPGLPDDAFRQSRRALAPAARPPPEPPHLGRNLSPADPLDLGPVPPALLEGVGGDRPARLDRLGAGSGRDFGRARRRGSTRSASSPGRSRRATRKAWSSRRSRPVRAPIGPSSFARCSGGSVATTSKGCPSSSTPAGTPGRARSRRGAGGSGDWPDRWPSGSRPASKPPATGSTRSPRSSTGSV